jgi:hypothetical protein
MENQVFDSIFEPGLKIDIANCITELIIRNRLDWLKKPLPKSPFWRNSIAENDSTIKELRTVYQAELTAVHDLLTVFSPKVLADYFKATKAVGFRMVKDETKKKMLLDLFKAQVKYIKSLEDIDKQALKLSDDKRPFTGTVSLPKKNKMSSLNG